MAERTYQNSDYRFGFNGQEQSDELDPDGNSYTAEFWQYSAVIGRRWNVDPVDKPYESSYLAFGGNPILHIDPFGDDWYVGTASGDNSPKEFRNDAAAARYYGKNGYINLGEHYEQVLDEVVVTGKHIGYRLANVIGWENKVGAAVSLFGTWMNDHTGISKRDVESAGQSVGKTLFELNPVYSAATVMTGTATGENLYGQNISTGEIALEAASVIPANKVFGFAKGVIKTKLGLNFGNFSKSLSASYMDRVSNPALREMLKSRSLQKDLYQGGEDITLSVREHLKEFEKFVPGRGWRQWSNERDFYNDFPKVIGNTNNRIHFNLSLEDNSIMNIRSIINNDNNIIYHPNRVTAWELHSIYHNKEWFSRTTFYIRKGLRDFEKIQFPSGL